MREKGCEREREREGGTGNRQRESGREREIERDRARYGEIYINKFTAMPQPFAEYKVMDFDKMQI